jgi:Tol biopolymer transport system component
VLGLESDGIYGPGTRSAHLAELEQRGLATSGVPVPPTTTTVALTTTTTVPAYAPILVEANWGVSGLVVTGPDGSVVRQLTNNPNDYGPVVSPDESMVLFHRSAVGDVNEDLFVINVDGTGEVNITNGGVRYPATERLGGVWSPDSQRITYSANEYGDYDVFVVNRDGSLHEGVTFSTDDEILPSWSTNGEWITYLRRLDPSTSYGYWRLDPDGMTNEFCGDTRDECDTTDSPPASTTTTTTTTTTTVTVNPPILVEAGDGGLVATNLDGSNPRQLTTNSADFYPVVSPDQSMVLFRRTHGIDIHDIFVVNADGTNERNVTNGIDYSAIRRDGSWSPDSQRITYASNDYGSWDIYVVGADGSDHYILTYDSGDEVEPIWSEDGQWIVYMRRDNQFYPWSYRRLDPDGVIDEFCGDTREECG